METIVIDMPPEDIKLIAIDIDGTLLTPEKEIAPATIEVIQTARKEGIVVTLATARRYLNTAPIADALGIDIPLILCDGSLIMQHPRTTVLYTNAMKAELAQQCVNLLAQHSMQPIVHRMNGVIEEMWTGPEENDNQWVEMYFAAFPENFYRAPVAELCVGQPDPLRVVVFDSEEAVYGLVPEVSALPCSWNAIRRGNYGSAELAMLAPDCSKASGLAALAHYLHIPLSQVMAIGDNNNDLEMLQAAGWGVAMGHAPDVIKEAADAVTTTNTEDGVARAIAHYALRRATIADSNSFNRETCL